MGRKCFHPLNIISKTEWIRKMWPENTCQKFRLLTVWTSLVILKKLRRASDPRDTTPTSAEIIQRLSTEGWLYHLIRGRVQYNYMEISCKVIWRVRLVSAFSKNSHHPSLCDPHPWRSPWHYFHFISQSFIKKDKYKIGINSLFYSFTVGHKLTSHPMFASRSWFNVQ